MIRLGTRGSALALAQARAVAALLDDEVELVTITTAGDLDRAGGDKSRWTGALEQALLAGAIDVAVHSAKDVPGELAADTAIVAVPPRADPRDVLVGAAGLDALAGGARVGTSALRRRAQLLAVRPDLDVVELRGNVDTRLRRLAAGRRWMRSCSRRPGWRGWGGRTWSPRRSRATSSCPRRARAASRSRRPRTAASRPPTIPPHARRSPPSGPRWPGWARRVTRRWASMPAPGGLRGFAGLPDGSEWLIDTAPDAEALAARMLSAGAGELLARAEAAA